MLYLKIKVSTETRPFFPLLQDASVQNVSRRPFVGDTYGNKGLCPGQFLAYVVYCWIPTMHSRALSLWFMGINHRIHILPDTTASPRSDEKRTGGNLNVSEEKHCQCSANWQADASQASAAPVIFFGSRGNPAEKPEHAEAEAEAASLVHTGAVCVRTSTQDSAVTVARRD